MDDSKLVVLATFKNPHDANLLKLRLEGHGIDAIVVNENTTSLFGATIFGPTSAFWIEVLVRSDDAEAALSIKEAFNSDNAENASETECVDEWQCGCGETVDVGFAVCWNCGKEFGSDP